MFIFNVYCFSVPYSVFTVIIASVKLESNVISFVASFNEYSSSPIFTLVFSFTAVAFIFKVVTAFCNCTSYVFSSVFEISAGISLFPNNSFIATSFNSASSELLIISTVYSFSFPPSAVITFTGTVVSFSVNDIVCVLVPIW